MAYYGFGTIGVKVRPSIGPKNVAISGLVLTVLASLTVQYITTPALVSHVLEEGRSSRAGGRRLVGR